MKKISLSARLEYVRTFHKSAANYMLELEQSKSTSNAANFMSSTTNGSHNPKSEEIRSETCICEREQRKPQWVECTKCQKFFKGRVSAICKAHPKVTQTLKENVYSYSILTLFEGYLFDGFQLLPFMWRPQERLGSKSAANKIFPTRHLIDNTCRG